MRTINSETTDLRLYGEYISITNICQLIKNIKRNIAQGVKWPSMNSGGFLLLQENLQRLPSSIHEGFRALTQTLNKKFDM